ncbi:MAG: hypothetical protein Q3986_01465, partial [Akkermansia sp.]|nr:hypothetical protein [Akkermansia sp.]
MLKENSRRGILRGKFTPQKKIKKNEIFSCQASCTVIFHEKVMRASHRATSDLLKKQHTVMATAKKPTTKKPAAKKPVAKKPA